MEEQRDSLALDPSLCARIYHSANHDMGRTNHPNRHVHRRYFGQAECSLNAYKHRQQQATRPTRPAFDLFADRAIEKYRQFAFRLWFQAFVGQ